MSNPVVAITWEDLLPYANEKGILEIVIRDSKKKYKTFQKVILNNLPKAQEQELTQKVLEVLNKNTLLNERNLQLLSNVTKLEKIGLLLNGMNLCATCAGFAIIYAKLDAMSTEINRQFSKLQKTVKDAHDVHTDYEFNKVLAEHTDMLDCQKRQHPYSESKMRELVDREYNVLSLLISTFEKDISGDKGTLIFAIFSLLAMFTVTLRNFDEMYYFNNCHVLGEKDVWHSSHRKWMSVYDKLTSRAFTEMLQDYGTFETEFSTEEVDIYYITLLDQVFELKSEIEDNQELIIAFGSPELFRQYKELSIQEVTHTIETAFQEAGKGMDEKTVNAAFKKAMSKVSLA